jgi:hypothetical protein
VTTDLSIGYTVDDTSAKWRTSSGFPVDALQVSARSVPTVTQKWCGADLKPKGNSMPEDKSNVEVVEQPGSEKRVREIIGLGKFQNNRFMADAVKAVESGDVKVQLHAEQDRQPAPMARRSATASRQAGHAERHQIESIFPILTREQNWSSSPPPARSFLASLVRQQAGLKRAIGSGVATVPTYVA